jgi:hypothetical protein
MNDPEYARGTFSRCSLLKADTSNKIMMINSSTPNHAFFSMDLQNALNAAWIVFMVIVRL